MTDWDRRTKRRRGKVELRLIDNAGDQIVTDATQVTEGAFVVTSSIEHESGTQATMSDVAMDEKSYSVGQ